MAKNPPDIEVRIRLGEIGMKLYRARKGQAEAMQEIAEAAREALEYGVTRAEIAERVKISRPTLNRLLGK
jgi:AcrR family transcriptional regulator